MRTLKRLASVVEVFEAVAASIGLGVTVIFLMDAALPSGLGFLVMALSLAAGAAAVEASRAVCGTSWPALGTAVLLVPAAPLALRHAVLMPVSWLQVVPFALGVLVVAACGSRAPVRRLVGAVGAVGAVAAVAAVGAVGAAWLVVVSSVGSAGAWSVDEPAPSDPRMVEGNGIVESVDTHAFLIRQGDAILRSDGRTEVVDFLDSPDPTAPMANDDQTGRPTGLRESYLWRMQLGARDADRALKPKMPDHFFNWWTHSGKGLIAGPSAATYAEEQYAQAVKGWVAGDRSASMYHLGAATHLVDDACTPPHEFFLAPNHRRYEEWMLAHQQQMKATSGGIYRRDFRVLTGHSGPEWSSAHTRGWVDECAHRAAELVVNAALPPPDDPAAQSALIHTAAHFRQTQQLTAGYIAFFFDNVGVPR